MPSAAASAGRAACRAYPARISSLPPPLNTAQQPSFAAASAAKYVVRDTPAFTTSMQNTAGVRRASAAVASAADGTSRMTSRAPSAKIVVRRSFTHSLFALFVSFASFALELS